MAFWARLHIELWRNAKRLSASLAVCALIFAATATRAPAQNIDCRKLRADIAKLDNQGSRPNKYASAARKQRAELERTIRHARSLGCDAQPFAFLGAPQPAQCPSLNARIRQMEDNLGQLQAAASQTDNSYARQQLVARYDAYCRSQPQAAPPEPLRGFFEALFGLGNAPVGPGPGAPPVPYESVPPIEAEAPPRGGSQAVCVRSCDGGFFPLDPSPRRTDPVYLTDLCQALCPNVEVAVFTRAPSREIKTAVSLNDGMPYMDLPNALAFQRHFDPACTCKPARQSWAQALEGAESLLGAGRRGDIVVTPEKAAELSRPVAAPPQKLATPVAEPVVTETAHDGPTKEFVGPDGVKRRVRIVGPTL